MRPSTAPAVLLACCLTACTAADAPTASPLAPRAAVAERGPTERPIAGSCDLTFRPAPPPAPPAPLVRQIDTGTCELSHLGHTQFDGVQDINFATFTQSGSRTFTAANGDVLRTTHHGVSTPRPGGFIDFVAEVTIVGGTGRFAHATGHMQGVGTANVATHTSTVRFEGTIAYDASDRSDR